MSAPSEPIEWRPWGSEITLCDQPAFTVKLVSLGRHQHTDPTSGGLKLLYLLQGFLKLTIEGQPRRLAEGQHLTIPKFAHHHLYGLLNCCFLQIEEGVG